MRKKFRSRSQSRRTKIIVGSSAMVFVALVSLAIWIIFAPDRSVVTVINNWNIEIEMRDTIASTQVLMFDGEDIRDTRIQVRQPANIELRINFGMASVVDVFMYDCDDLFIGRRTIFFDESLTISPTSSDKHSTFVIIPREDADIRYNEQNHFTVTPVRQRGANLVSENRVRGNIIFDSPSCLQLALFAHMAYFPFDFNTGERPHYHDFKPFHHKPFYDHVMSYNAWGFNAFGFNFQNEMLGWNLLGVFDDAETGFRAVLYHNDDKDKVVISIRGSYGGIFEALTTQEGTWWCNFQSLLGIQHSHTSSLSLFLHDPSVFELLTDSDIYITGHSLGGYLSYRAVYELAQMGLEENVKRVVAFSAPTFNMDTHNAINALNFTTQQRIIHFYVYQDLIAGITGADGLYDFPGYDSFVIVSRLLRNLRNVHGMDVPSSFQIISDAIGFAEGVLPFSTPAHIREVLWVVEGAFSENAIKFQDEFNELVWHELVAQTWHSPRPVPNIPLIPNVVEGFAVDLVFDLLDRIFDADTHFMMNFYDHLSTQSLAIR